MDINSSHLCKQDISVCLVSNDPADGRGDFASRKHSTSDLVKKWLEKVVIETVDKGNAYMCLLEGYGCC